MLYCVNVPITNETQYRLTNREIDFETLDHCPICGKQIYPIFIHGQFTHSASSLKSVDVVLHSQLNALYECPNCHNGILVSYDPKFELGNKYNVKDVIKSWKTFTIKSIYPTAIAQFPYNEIISKISPRFKDIYIQSLQAKLDGKNELVGIGYRKSIEFLIKDYLLHIQHENSDKVPSLPLGECIKLIDSNKIQTLAKASTWLGNDETHYVRKHTDKDISDLEKFLDALVYYLTYELTVEEASSFIGKS